MNQPTTFGQVIDSRAAKRLVMEAVNMLLLGAPENAILSDLRHKYDVEISSLSTVVSDLEKELNQMASAGYSDSEKASRIASSLSSHNPLGIHYQKMAKELSTIERNAKKRETQTATKQEELRKATKKYNDVALKAGRSFGEWVVDRPDDLADELSKVVR